jgi:hypothetical protein
MFYNTSDQLGIIIFGFTERINKYNSMEGWCKYVHSVLLTFLHKLLYGLYNEPLRLGVRERRENCKNQTTLLKN